MVDTAGEPRRLLILGGTTFLGVHMTELALRRGYSVTLFNRGRTHSDLSPGIERLQGNRDGKLSSLEGRSWDAVIDNSGYVPRHVRMSAQLLAPRVSHYLFVSTISVYADFTRPNDEESPLAALEDETCEDPKKVYGALKALCEKAVEAALPGRTAIVRPGLIVGPHDPTDRFTYWPARAAQGGEILAPGDAQTSIQLIDARDLARFCLDALEQRLCGVFNATSPPAHFSMGDIVRESVASALELAKPSVPPRAVWVAPQFLDAHHVQPFVDIPVWFPPDGAMGALHHTRVDRALAAGLTLSTLATTTRDTLTWYLARSGAERSRLRTGISAEREHELLQLWYSQTA